MPTSINHAFTGPQTAPAFGSPDPGLPSDDSAAHGTRTSSSTTSSASSGSARLRHPRLTRSTTIKTTSHRKNWKPGAEPGLDPASRDRNAPHMQDTQDCSIDIVDYGTEYHRTYTTNRDLEKFLEQPRPANTECRWINVSGLSIDVVKALGTKYKLHRLACEDLFHTSTRTKVDWYSDHAFIVLTLQKLVRLHYHDQDTMCDCPLGIVQDDQYVLENAHQAPGLAKPGWRSVPAPRGPLPQYEEYDPELLRGSSPSPVARPIRTLHRYEPTVNEEHTAYMEKHSALAYEGCAVSVEQVAIFLLADNTVISFFEHSGFDVWAPVHERLQSADTIPRRSADASMLLQAIIDTIVDLSIPVKDAYNRARKEMQIDVLTNPDVSTSKTLYVFSEEIDILQNLFRPIVHLVTALRDHHRVEPVARPSDRQLYGDQTQNDAGGLDDRLQTHNLRRPDALTKQRSSMYSSPTSVVISPLTYTYLGDVLDHCITMIQSLEQMDASANNLSSLIFNTVGAKNSNFTMILTLVTVFFSPLTFICGYFGMNFTRFSAIHEHSDAFFWLVSLPAVFAFMVVVSGQTFYRAVINKWARLKISSKRKKRFERTREKEKYLTKM